MEVVIYTRVSTEEQNPRSQLTEIKRYAEGKGYRIAKVFEDKVSGSVDPFSRPAFRQALDYCRKNGVSKLLCYDITRLYRAKDPAMVFEVLKKCLDEHGVIVEFVSEPTFEDPLFNRLWEFIKSFISSYERRMISLRTRYGMAKVKQEGRLYHRPSLVHYYAAWIYGKEVGELKREEVEAAKRQLKAIVSQYWYDRAVKKTKIGELLARRELREFYIRFPKAPRDYKAFLRLMKSE
mgnify:CR=1 FL=1